ncbi:MAG: tail fiber domain-containing protein [Ignavibacteriae bacterium]|nr:tail fiber domain-containing protein [Ignavibacteriota bacterium]
MHAAQNKFKTIILISFSLIIFGFSLSLAQEVKEKKVNEIAKIEKPNSTQAVEGDVIFSDGTNDLLRITDEGTSGAIQFSSGIPSNTDFKLYRNGATLYFNGDPVGSNLSLELGDLSDVILSAESSYYLGSNSGTVNSLGTGNTGLGYSAIGGISDGDKNTGIGAYSLTLLSTGSKNTALGNAAGYHALGDGNVFLGYEAGFNENGSNKLYIDNSATFTPLIWGDFEKDSVKVNGKAHITTSLSVGSGSKVVLNNSIAVGNNTEAHGLTSIAVGEESLAWGFHSSAFGLGIRAMSYVGTAIGRYNVGDPLDIFSEWNENDVLFEIGNGTDNNNRSNAVTVLKNGNVGFGPSAPTSSLHVDAVNGVLFDGLTTGSIPVEGPGSRMMWYQGKSAFRAGNAGFDNQWDDVNIGSYSTALNYRTIASGNSSFASGYQTEASGLRATAMGSETKASGLHSSAIGSGTEATGDFSTAIGRYVKASGNGTIFIGDNSATSIQNANNDNRFAARFSNGYKFFTSSDLSTYSELLGGQNAWSTTSDSTKKENFLKVDGEEVLNKISKFNLRSWNYIGQDPSKFRHYGPMAQEFFNAFGNDGIGIIGNDTTITTSDFDGINFIAIQALEKRSKEQISSIQNLESRIKELEDKNQELVKLNSEYRTENAEFRNQNLELHKDVEQIKNALNQIIDSKNEIRMTTN